MDLPSLLNGKDPAIHVNGIRLENRTDRHTEAPGMAEGDAIKTVTWADDNGGELECDDPEWNSDV